MDKVLIVDDDEGVLRLMSAALEREGYETFAQESPPRALQLAVEQKIRVVVSDIMMPEMDGLTLLTKLKEKSPEILVIFITANATIDSALFALKEGAFAYLRKPFEPYELVQAVKFAFDKVHLLEQNKKFVAELKTAKDYNEAILKSLTYTVVTMDKEGKIRKVNHAMEKLLGYSEAELINRPMDTIFPAGFLQTAWKDLTGQHQVKDFPVTFRRKDGTTIQQSFSGSVMRDELENVVGFLGTSHAA